MVFNQPLLTIRVEIICIILLPAMLFIGNRIFMRKYFLLASFTILLEGLQAGGLWGELGWIFAFLISAFLLRAKPELDAISQDSTKYILLLTAL